MLLVYQTCFYRHTTTDLACQDYTLKIILWTKITTNKTYSSLKLLVLHNNQTLNYACYVNNYFKVLTVL